MKDLAIIGVGGVGRALRFFVDDVNRAGGDWRLVGFLDDDAANHGKTIHDLPVLGSVDWLSSRPHVHGLLGIGDPANRRSVLDHLQSVSANPPVTLIHPQAYVGASTLVGAGSVIYPGARVDPDCMLGECVLINQNATVGHDSELASLATLAPLVAIGGNTRLGDGCSLGIGCSVVQGVRVGSWAVVGAGAAVISSIPDGVTAVGVPARVVGDRR